MNDEFYACYTACATLLRRQGIVLALGVQYSYEWRISIYDRPGIVGSSDSFILAHLGDHKKRKER